ncbi:hypothetical protein [Sporosarcina trichiuri]|uniref:hypothetical protein n=1 Tax=Sporosarcina trichiuri TaxID=3056445 RepID=UPI0025B2CA4E|nr:hypothetical protein [Sporosarcina sp. 0.2-SM1T-5]WJY26573.1 hypothetical protein QWT68_10825 [Sporosarcina sp. 0.2-SM1T-5]
MANVPIREKVKRIMSSASDGSRYSETSKRAGLYILYTLFAAAALLLAALAAGLVQTGHYIGSAVVLLAGAAIGYVLVQLIRA